MTTRNYSNFLMFEGVLENSTTNTSALSTLKKSVLTPQVSIVEGDCGTLLGNLTELTFNKEGSISLEDGNVALTRNMILSKFSSGQYFIKLRSSSTCISQDGVCQSCYYGSNIHTTPPTIGTLVQIPPVYEIVSEVIAGDGSTLTFPLTTDSSLYDYFLIVLDGVVVASGVTLLDGSLVFDTAPVLGSKYIIRHFRSSSLPLLGYFAKTYSGSLLGVKSMDTPRLPMRESLYLKAIDDGVLKMAVEEVKKIRGVPTTYLEYLSSVPSKLEQALLALYLNAVYGAIT